MRIFARTLTGIFICNRDLIPGLSFEIEVNPFDTILDIKHKIYQTRGHKPEKQRLVYKNKTVVHDDWTVADYGMLNEDTVYLMSAVEAA